MNTYKRYKFRAEFWEDAMLFFWAIKPYVEEFHWQHILIDKTASPHKLNNWSSDVIVSFTAHKELTLSAMCWIASQLIDCHVIAETLQYERKFTGERIYDNVELKIKQPPAVVRMVAVSMLLEYQKSLNANRSFAQNSMQNLIQAARLPKKQKTSACDTVNAWLGDWWKVSSDLSNGILG